MAVLGERMDFDDPSTFSFNHRDGDVTIPRIKWVEPLKSEIQHFFDCILNNEPCITGTDHAAKVVNILRAAQ
jgi:predicted dehydrogenase